jgi:hypothetical protein
MENTLRGIPVLRNPAKQKPGMAFLDSGKLAERTKSQRPVLKRLRQGARAGSAPAGASCSGFTSTTVTSYQGNMAYIRADVLDKTFGYRYNVYTIAIHVFQEVFDHAQDCRHFSQD